MKKIIFSAALVLMNIALFATGHTVNIVGQTNITCNGMCNGTATASVTGGIGPYGYSWGPGATATGLCAGSYVLTVTDSSDMSTATVPYTITQPSALVATAGGGYTVCAGGAVVLNAFASGGTPAYTYSWSPGVFLSTTTGPNPVCAPTTTITYTITVTDMNGCNAYATTTVFVTAPIVVSTSVTNANCGMCDGQVVATASGGSAPYSYSWSPSGSTAPTVLGLCAGSYTVTVFDGTGCVGTATAIVNSTSSITGAVYTVTNASCGSNDGSISVTSVTGGIPPYTYNWAPVGTSTSTITNLPAGTYFLTVYDSVGCNYSTPISVNNSTGPTAVSLSVTNTYCSAATGSISIGTVTGGVAPYTYAFNGGAFSSMVNYNGLSIGTYSIQIMDSIGCIYFTSATVSNLNSPAVTLDSLINPSCTGGTTGSIAINVSGGTPGYSFSWSNGANTQNISGVIAGSYNVTVSDGAGCSTIASFFLSNGSSVYATVSSTYASCGATGLSTVYAGGGVPPYTYSWNTTPVQTTQTAVNLNPGAYICTITDANGCYATVYTYIYAHCYNVIKGRVYNDINGNCIQDAGEAGLSGRSVYGSSTWWSYGYTDVNGDYTIFTSNMNNIVTQALPLYSTQLCPVPPAGQIANFSVLGDTIFNLDFADQYVSSINDLVVSYAPGVARPGFSQWGYLFYRNQGTTVINSVTVSLAHDSILTYSSSSPIAASSYTYPNLSWNIGTLNPGQSGYIYTYFNVPTITSGGYLGRVLNYSATINPVAGDSTPVNNYSNTWTMITGSWDPNEKEVSPSGDILATDSILHYKIQFQNTGTDTAFNIVLKDTLSQYLDPATVVPGIASHPYTFDIAFNGELTWTFSNILLPDSNRNEPGSHGFAEFTVKQRANNPVGTQIDNTAHIYFDFNPAVVTNTVTNEVVDVTTGIETASTNNAVKVYPNPFGDQTTFEILSDKLNETYFFEMTDMLGKTVMKIKTSEKQFIISRNGLENGMYFYSIVNAQGVVGIGKVIIK
jgi:hypothetical protein